MKKLIAGSSKDFYATDNPNFYRVIFKDAIHGRGKAGVIKGTGRLREEFCYYFYKLLEKEGIPTHLAPQNALLDSGLLVKKMDMIPLEIICRFVARGQWTDTHKFPILKEGVVLDEPILEYCLKWKEKTTYLPYAQLTDRQKKWHSVLSRVKGFQALLLPSFEIKDDPRVNFDMIRALNRYAADARYHGHLIETPEEEAELRRLGMKVNLLLKEFLAEQGWILEDGKFEIGRDENGLFCVADEYTQDSSRIRDKNGNSLSKDLFRQRRPENEIYDNYAKLTEGIKNYVK